MKKIFCLLVPVCVVLAACGGSDEAVPVETANDSSSTSTSSSVTESDQADTGELSAGEQAIADVLSAELLTDLEFPFPDEATCISETAVSEVGLDKLIELGYSETSPESSLDEPPLELQDAFINAILDCIGTTGLAALIVEGSSEGDDGPPLRMEDAECIADELGREQWFSYIESSFAGDDTDEAFGPEFFAEIFKACPQILVSSIQDDLGLDQAQAECVVDALADTLIDALSSGALEGDASPEVLEEILLTFIGCGIDMSQLQ
jgi:hypothetical protein